MRAARGDFRHRRPIRFNENRPGVTIKMHIRRGAHVLGCDVRCVGNTITVDGGKEKTNN